MLPKLGLKQCLSGQHPALAINDDIIAETEEFQSARSCIQHLQNNLHDLDRELSTSDKADLAAFSSLIQNTLEPATLYTTWCESLSFSDRAQVQHPAHEIASQFQETFIAAKACCIMLMSYSPLPSWLSRCACM